MNGNTRFEHYLVQLENLFQQSAGDHNPALWLYTNNARTTLFMLEGLAKIYAGLHNEKKFGKLKEHFKLVEDALGAIDYYDNMAKDLSGHPAIPTTVISYLQAQAREKTQHLNELLVEKKWIGEHAVRIKKIRKNLHKMDWLEPEKEVKGISSFYKDAIKDINKKWSGMGKVFFDLESQVHEMRRALRWLSIYPQALQGLIQLSDDRIVDFNTDKYITPEIVNSPFNKLPERGDHTFVLQLEQKYFLSLSWLIARLGTIKDNGLRLLAITEALQQTENLAYQTALNKSGSFFGSDSRLLDRLLEEATSVCRLFFQEKNLDKLVAGISGEA